ncbi:hypothetical protein BpHYR1_052297 [Brachionus plicatilis]|uniref:Uncharacterized protein n=1 Tax=Brachionus plicatilis TaxID=10195 RepID=A0A3M7QTR1_BRAPC|nr:hypothetical protein BpHYR1_052297 [Brachionus plicatilis]
MNGLPIQLSTTRTTNLAKKSASKLQSCPILFQFKLKHTLKKSVTSDMWHKNGIKNLTIFHIDLLKNFSKPSMSISSRKISVIKFKSLITHLAFIKTESLKFASKLFFPDKSMSFQLSIGIEFSSFKSESSSDVFSPIIFEFDEFDFERDVVGKYGQKINVTIPRLYYVKRCMCIDRADEHNIVNFVCHWIYAHLVTIEAFRF